MLGVLQLQRAAALQEDTDHGPYCLSRSSAALKKKSKAMESVRREVDECVPDPGLQSRKVIPAPWINDGRTCRWIVLCYRDYLDESRCRGALVVAILVSVRASRLQVSPCPSPQLHLFAISKRWRILLLSLCAWVHRSVTMSWQIGGRHRAAP